MPSGSGERPAWPIGLDGIAYGCDYNPEQWPAETVAEDVRLMGEAGVSFVTLAVFAWASLEVRPGVYDWGWLDAVMDALAVAGIAVDLATATAAPPPWFSHRYPDSLLVGPDGATRWYGSRQAFCPSSTDYRQAAGELTGAIAGRYGGHPALAMWHVGNEFGCHNPACYCDRSAESFRGWLRRRYQDDLGELNRAWGTSFWSQAYRSWEELIPPRQTVSFANPGHLLDWARFCSDELLGAYLAERSVLRRLTPGVPITTNFMSFFKPVDYQAWAREVDVVSNDHYLLGHLPRPEVHLSLSGDLTRGLAGGPWWLMEHSPSAVNWQRVNQAKAPGEMIRNSLTHVARGADAVGFFQWRASPFGAEKYHSAMVPHAGTDTMVWREVVDLGAKLRRLSEVAGSRVEADAALVFTWDSWWAAEGEAHPSSEVRVVENLGEWHRAFWEAAVTTDVVAPDADLSRYRLVVVPNLYLVSDAQADALAEFVRNGGHLLVTWFSGVVDADDHVRLGGYPGAFRDLLGVRTEEFFPLPHGVATALSDGSTGRRWSELGRSEGADVMVAFAAGPVAGSPALTRHRVGSGWAYYLATHLEGPDLDALVGRLVDESGTRRAAVVWPGVEAVRRVSGNVSYLFLINHTDEAQTVPASGIDLLSGATADGSITVGPGDVAVIRQPAAG